MARIKLSPEAHDALITIFKTRDYPASDWHWGGTGVMQELSAAGIIKPAPNRRDFWWVLTRKGQRMYHLVS